MLRNKNFSHRFADYYRLLYLVLLFCPVVLLGQETQQVIDLQRLSGIDTVILDGIEAGDLPGAVVLITHRGETIYRKAFGHRSLRPLVESMTVDTIFDLA